VALVWFCVWFVAVLLVIQRVNELRQLGASCAKNAWTSTWRKPSGDWREKNQPIHDAKSAYFDPNVRLWQSTSEWHLQEGKKKPLCSAKIQRLQPTVSMLMMMMMLMMMTVSMMMMLLMMMLMMMMPGVKSLFCQAVLLQLPGTSLLEATVVRSCVAEGAEAGAAHAEGAPEQGIVGACTCGRT
jgi:hypothetical protein